MDQSASAAVDSKGEPTVKLASEATPQEIMEHKANVFSDDPARQLQSTQHFRRLLSIGNIYSPFKRHCI